MFYIMLGNGFATSPPMFFDSREAAQLYIQTLGENDPRMRICEGQRYSENDVRWMARNA